MSDYNWQPALEPSHFCWAVGPHLHCTPEIETFRTLLLWPSRVQDEDLQIADNGDITPNMACPITGISVRVPLVL